jgi:hypothetical protein
MFCKFSIYLPFLLRLNAEGWLFWECPTQARALTGVKSVAVIYLL